MMNALCTAWRRGWSGLLLWLTYGLKSGDTPLIMANGITLLLASAVMVLKWNNERA